MRYIKHLLLLLSVLMISACTSKTPAITLDPAEIMFQERIQSMLDNSSYKSGDKVVRFKKGRFTIYDDSSYAPTAYGTIVLQNHSISFVSRVRTITQNIDINDTAIRLYSKTREKVLDKYEVKDFYQPENYFEAIEYGYVEDLQRLYNEGLMINQSNELGNFPIMQAIYLEREAMLDFFLKHQADIRAENGNGYTALHVALEAKNISMVRQLLKAGAKEQILACESFLEVIEKDESFTMAKLMITEGFDASCNKSELLFWVIGSESLAHKHHTLTALNFLLSKQVKTDVFSFDQGDSAIMRAAAVGNDAVLKKLIDHGSNTLLKDQNGRTALDFDSLYLEQKNPKIELLLRASGLHEGIKANSDKYYKDALKLLNKGNGDQAYEVFTKLSEKYQQERFDKGLIQAIKSHKKPTIKMLKELIDIYAKVHAENDEGFYLDMISFYEKMLPLVDKKEDIDENGNFLEGSVWFVYEKIDRLYELLFEKTNNIDYLYKRWQNYKRFGTIKKLKRLDIKSAFKTRYIGETLDGKPFGKGTLQYSDGSKYFGHVFYYIRHGKGKMTYANGLMHDGKWQNDSKEGKAFFTDEHKALYLGNFINNQLVGEKKLLRKGIQ